MDELTNDSVLGRLLEEISWDGKSVRRYREGGRGMENVLTAEVFMMLDFLPREDFLAAVLRRAHGAAETTELAAAESAQASLSLLPGDAVLRPAGPSVQPDAWITTPSCQILVEAKRIRSSAFQNEQLTREYLALVQDCGDRKPLLLLILGSQPPVKVKGIEDRLEPAAAVALHLDRLLQHAEQITDSSDDLHAQIDDRLAWITWSEIKKVVLESSRHYSDSTGTDPMVKRVSAALTRAIDWHS